MRDDLPDVPDPALLDVRADGAREALEALATSTTREAFDWLFDRALERPIHPEGYPESRARFFGPTGEPAPAPAIGAPADTVLRTFRERVAPMTFNAQHPSAGIPTRSASQRVTSSSTNAPTGPACQTSTPCCNHWASVSPATDMASGGGVK